MKRAIFPAAFQPHAIARLSPLRGEASELRLEVAVAYERDLCEFAEFLRFDR